LRKIYKEKSARRIMNFVKRIFKDEADEEVHLQFQKFGKGEFRNRALIEAKKSGKGWTIKTSAEFANELVTEVAKKLGSGKARVTGCIVSTSDLTGEIEFKDKKQFQGVKKYIIDREMPGEEIIDLIRKSPKSFFALSLETGNTKLKIKAKAPKSGKPGSKGEEKPKADFCSLKTDDREIAEDFIFEKPDFRNAEISHTFDIEKLEIPEELENSEDFALIREKSKRVGKVIRNAVIDGQEMKKEVEFRV
jgi:hypothetical protein